jgi:hypothetical protein
MPPFLAPLVVNLAAAAAYDGLRPRLRRFVRRPAPPTFAQGGGRSRPPSSPANRIYPVWREPAPTRDRRG